MNPNKQISWLLIIFEWFLSDFRFSEHVLEIFFPLQKYFFLVDSF